MALNRDKRGEVLRRELQAVMKQENKLRQAALETRPAGWKSALEEKVPPTVYGGLESAFGKGFAVVFSKGRGIIEKSYRKDTILEDHSIRDYAVQVKGGRRELRRIHRNARRTDLWNLAITTAEGVGLGLLGIGIPDIVLFISTLLKGVYQTALNYGYDYVSREEQMLILKMMAAALSSGEEWQRRSEEIDRLMAYGNYDTDDEAYQTQIHDTAGVFAVDMLLLKFVQGMPVIGVLGGAANPVYYRRVLRYVQMKYRKRYLWKLLAEQRRKQN